MASEDADHSPRGPGCLTLSENQVFTFRDENSHADFKQRLLCMQEQGMLTDVTLTAGDVSVKCHRVALAAASTYFYRLFNTDQPPDTVKLEDVSPKVLEPLVGFMYTTNIEISAELIKDLSRACGQLQLAGLKKGCDQFIANRVEPYNVMGLHMFATQHHLEITMKATEKCLTEKPEEVLRLALDTEYQELSQEALVRWISNDEIAVPNEDIIFQLVEKWFQVDPPRNNEACIEEVLSHVRLSQCTPSFLVKTVRKSFLAQHSKCRKLVDDAFDFLVLKLEGPRTEETVSERNRPRGQSLENKSDDTQHTGPGSPKLVLIGGVSNGEANGRCWTFGEDQQWEDLTVLPQEQQQYPFHFGACAVDDGIILTGGGTSIHSGWYMKSTQNSWLYKASEKRWIGLPPMNQARSGHAMLVVSGEVYVFGGYARRPLDSVEKLDSSRQKWTTLNPLPCAVNLCHAFLIGEDIYIISSTSQTTLKCDTKTWTWQVMASMPSSNNAAAVINIEEEIYVLGGKQGKDCMTYCTKSNEWTELEIPSKVHAYGSVMVHKGKIILCGGEQERVVDTAEEYDPESDDWSDSTIVLPKPLGGHAMVMMK